MSIGSKIRFLRKEAKESQDHLAQVANVSRVSIGNYERNTRTPDAETLRQIANHYGVSLNFLVDSSIGIDSIDEYRIQDMYDFIKKLDADWEAPLEKEEYILTYKNINNQVFTFRDVKHSIHQLFDIEDSLHNHNYMTKDNGFTIVGQVQPTYKGKPLTTEIVEKIESILDTLIL